MDYSAQFAVFREAKKLSQDELASLAGCHRNTVINVERGRPVKFVTIVGLMGTMGYAKDSRETKLLALLWLQATAGVMVSPTESETYDDGHIELSSEQLRADLASRIKRMNRAQLEVFHFASSHAEIFKALTAIRSLTEGRRAKP